MSKEKIISVRLSTETESKLQFLIKEANTGDIISEQGITDIIERCIHNEWCSINYANLQLVENVIIDERYVKIINERSNELLEKDPSIESNL